MAPPGFGAAVGCRVVGTRKNALAHTAGAQARVQIDPGQFFASLAVFLQHLAQRQVAPGGGLSSKEQAVREFVLAFGDSGLKGFHPSLSDELVGCRSVGGIGWPHFGQQQGLDFAVGRVVRQRLREVLKVAVDVHVFVGHAPHMRKPVRVERVDVEHRHTLGFGGCTPSGVLQGMDLHARAAITLHPVAGAADDQQRLGVGGTVEHHVHGERFSVPALERVGVRVHRQACRLRRDQEFLSGLGIAA